MYFDGLLTGGALPEGTVCLTFDDGPGTTDGNGVGPRTLDLAQFLNDQNVGATFFMVGKFASDLPEILPVVENLGHLIGNHTYDHPNLVHYGAAGGDVVSQVTRTDGLIRNWIDSPVIYFRPPYGSWSGDIAATMNGNLTAALSHVGPIGWDIDGGDWDFWRNNGSPDACATQYLQAIENEGRGIILNHDCTADQDIVRRGNRTFDLMKILIPKLVERGYQFTRLDSVPGIPGGDQSTIPVALRGFNGFYVSPQQGGGGPIIVNGPAVGSWEPLVVEDLYVGKVALRASTGAYVSPQGGGGGSVLANGPAVGEWEPLDLISFGNNRIAFRTITGHFLSCDTNAGNLLLATTWLTLLPECVFTFEYPLR
jgi:peptidoglycan/xylan/chitin deacetylase (PgdA/CDA1 family)